MIIARHTEHHTMLSCRAGLAPASCLTGLAPGPVQRPYLECSLGFSLGSQQFDQTIFPH